MWTSSNPKLHVIKLEFSDLRRHAPLKSEVIDDKLEIHLFWSTVLASSSIAGRSACAEDAPFCWKGYVSCVFQIFSFYACRRVAPELDGCKSSSK